MAPGRASRTPFTKSMPLPITTTLSVTAYAIFSPPGTPTLSAAPGTPSPDRSTVVIVAPSYVWSLTLTPDPPPASCRNPRSWVNSRWASSSLVGTMTIPPATPRHCARDRDPGLADPADRGIEAADHLRLSSTCLTPSASDGSEARRSLIRVSAPPTSWSSTSTMVSAGTAPGSWLDAALAGPELPLWGRRDSTASRRPSARTATTDQSAVTARRGTEARRGRASRSSRAGHLRRVADTRASVST